MTLKNEVLNYFKDHPPNTKVIINEIVSKYSDDLRNISLVDRYEIWKRITNDKELKNKVDKCSSRYLN